MLDRYIGERICASIININNGVKTNGIKIVIPLKILMVGGYVKVRESLSTWGMISVDTILLPYWYYLWRSLRCL